MRVAYLYLSANFNGSSVQNKIISQITALRGLGVEAKGIFFTGGKVSKGANIDTGIFEFVQLSEINQGWFRSFKNSKLRIEILREWLDQNAHLYDLFYLRYPGATRELSRLMVQYGKKTIIEYQTLDIAEIKSNYSENPFGLRPSRFLSWLEFQAMPLYNEHVYGAKIVGRSRGAIGVTSEITKYVSEKIKPNANIIFATIGNGVWVDKIKIRKSPPDMGSKKYQLLILIGGSGVNNWIGLDRIIDGLSQYKGNSSFELLVCGNVDARNYKDLDNVKYLGYKNETEIEGFIETVHLALGSFAMYRTGLTQGSTLKLRDYCARGVPFAYGYFDEDLEPLVEKGLALRFEQDGLIDFNKVDAFLTNLESIADVTSELRKYAELHLDYSIKMKELKEVFHLAKGTNEK